LQSELRDDVEALLLALPPLREPLIEFFAAWSLRLRHERVGVEVPPVMVAVVAVVAVVAELERKGSPLS
jgi:hypothetical protein